MRASFGSVWRLMVNDFVVFLISFVVIVGLCCGI